MRKEQRRFVFKTVLVACAAVFAVVLIMEWRQMKAEEQQQVFLEGTRARYQNLKTHTDSLAKHALTIVEFVGGLQLKQAAPPAVLEAIHDLRVDVALVRKDLAK